MSESERTLADSMGKFAKVVVDGHKVPDIEWTTGRIILSNKRLVLVGKRDRETIGLAAVRSIKGRHDVGQSLAAVPGYVSLQAESDVTLVSTADLETFENALYGAVLDKQVVFAKHPAVEGGVVQDADWEKGQLAVDDGTVGLALGSGRFVEIDVDDVGAVEGHEGTVQGEERLVLKVEHAEDGTAVETHLSGTRRHTTILGSLLRKGELQNATDVELTDDELEVVMALYSGVSPFQIPEFVGMDVDRVEELYEGLIERGIVERIRTRRDVSLKPRGRSVASEAIGEE